MRVIKLYHRHRMYKLDGPIKWDPLVIVGEPNETVVIVVLTVGQLLWSD